VNLNNQWHLRINLGNGKYVWAKVFRSAKRERNRWIDFVWDLTQAERTGNWFAYTVRLRLKNAKENGVIGINLQANRVLFPKLYL
jgi:hypothetical protein